jgi:hypothetical protein
MLLLAASGAVAEDAWRGAIQKVRGSAGYALRYRYQGPDGNFLFQYQSKTAGSIRTEILPGSKQHAGTVIVYDPSVSREYVTVKNDWIQLRRSVGSKDIKDTSLVTPLYQQLIAKVDAWNVTPQVSTEEPGLKRLEFTKGNEVQEIYLNDRSEIVRYRHLKGGKVHEQLDFQTIDWL